MTETEFYRTVAAVLRACEGMTREQVREAALQLDGYLVVRECEGADGGPAAVLDAVACPPASAACPPARGRIRWRRGDLSGLYYTRDATVGKVRVGAVSPADPERMALPGWVAYLVDAEGALHSTGLYKDLRTAMAAVESAVNGPPVPAPVAPVASDPARRRVLSPTSGRGPVVHCGVCGSELDLA